MTAVYLSGIGITPFGRHTDTPLADLGVQAAKLALADAGLDYEAIGEVFAASMLAPPQTALRVSHRLGMTGVPVTAVESASASGLVALRHAITAVASGHCTAALAIGYEKTTRLEPGGVVPAPTGAWGAFPPQVQYALEATRWLHESGSAAEVYGAVAAKSHNQARNNPLAARHAAEPVTAAEVMQSRMVATPLTRMMCHVAVDGAAAVVVTADRRPDSVSVLAIEQASRLPDLGWPDDGPVAGPPSQTTETARRAFRAAGVEPKQIGVVSLHDLCVSEEVVTLLALGLVDERRLVELAVSDGLTSTGQLPTNTDGGCIARGHPFAATPLAQVGEIVTQLRGNAGPRQVPEPRVGLAHAAGGGGSCVVALLGV